MLQLHENSTNSMHHRKCWELGTIPDIKLNFHNELDTRCIVDANLNQFSILHISEVYFLMFDVFSQRINYKGSGHLLERFCENEVCASTESAIFWCLPNGLSHLHNGIAVDQIGRAHV